MEEVDTEDDVNELNAEWEGEANDPEVMNGEVVEDEVLNENENDEDPAFEVNNDNIINHID